MSTSKVIKSLLNTANISKIYIGKSLVKNIIIGKRSGRLPDEYQEVQYIKSVGGGSYSINTGVYGSGYLTARLKFTPTISNRFMGKTNVLRFGQTQSQQYIFENRTVTSKLIDNQIDTIKYTYYEYSISRFQVNDLPITMGQLIMPEQLDNTSTFCLFNVFGSSASSTAVQIYEFKFYSENDVLLRDYVPCYRKSDNVAGLYDLVNNEFKTNEGTDSFIIGPISN